MMPWINFLALLPATIPISIAFLRFYNEQDFTVLRLIANPRIWSNRLTVAALLAAVANFGIVGRSPCEAWDRRNRETNRLAAEAQRRVEEEQRRVAQERAAADRSAEAKEQASRRAAIAVERDLALLSYLADPSAENQRTLTQVLALLNEYRSTLC
ncbi:MAG: hypothetical protein ACOYM4_22315 [Nodosilinea sp.]|jgi:hypothetical protein